MKKNILIICMIMAYMGVATAQITDMPLRVYLPENDAIPMESQVYLHDKLTYLMTGNMVGVDCSVNSQFMISAKSTIESKNVVASVPAMFTVNANLTLYIVDMITGNIFTRMMLPMRGTGQSETKAYINAFKNVRLNGDKVDKFIAQGREKIKNYYEKEGETIMQQARTAAEMKDYERALFMLTAIPTFAPTVYAKAQPMILDIYKQYIDYQGAKILAEAKNIWNASQNREGAERVGAMLSQIELDAACYGEVERLAKEIKNRIGEEWELTKKRYEDSVDLERMRIEAAQRIGVAYGNNQQPNTTNVGW